MGKEHVKNVFFMVEDGVTTSQAGGARRGIEQVLQIARIRVAVSIFEVVWRISITKGGKKYDNPLQWVLEEGAAASAKDGYLNAGRILDCLGEDKNQYTVVVVQSPLYFVRSYADGTSKVVDDIIGLARDGVGCVMTTAGCGGGSSSDHEEYMYFLSSHEFGHVCGLIPEGRTVRVKAYKDYGTHCTNLCNMMLGMPKTEVMKETLRKRLFCNLCAGGLKKRFIR